MKKTNLTNIELQKKVLPYIQKAETEIKKVIVNGALHLVSKYKIREEIKLIIRACAKHLPLSLIDRDSYIMGLYYFSEKQIKEFYTKVTVGFFLLLGIIKKNVELYATIKATRKDFNTPYGLLKIYEENKSIKAQIVKAYIDSDTKLKASAKGFPNVFDYPNALKKKIKELAESVTKASDNEKVNISIWAKAELDLRHENQLNMIDDLKKSGVRYAWTSSHPNCSKRCEHWQGRLFDLTSEKSELTGNRMKEKINGNTVYCFNEVINKVDKYGYTNNIIVGFNCRHKLIPYTPNSVAPTEFTKEEVEKNRIINSKLREMEREIRKIRQEAQITFDIKERKMLYNKANKLFEKYKEFANKYGYAYYEWRCK